MPRSTVSRVSRRSSRRRTTSSKPRRTKSSVSSTARRRSPELRGSTLPDGPKPNRGFGYCGIRNTALFGVRYFFSVSLQPFLSGCGLRFCRLAFALIPGCGLHFALRFPVCGPRLPAAVSLSAGRCCGIDGQERNALRIGKHGAFGPSLHDLLIVGREVQFGVFETFGARSLAFESRRP